MNSKRRNAMKFSLACAASLLCVGTASFGASLNSKEKNMQKCVYIVHGYDASPKSHWFAWLKGEIEKSGARAEILTMPTPANPRLDEWLKTLRESVKFEGEVYLVGHSLGCPTILNFLQSSAMGGTVEGVVLVSGLAKPLSDPQFKILDEFMDRDFDFERIKAAAKQRAVVAAKDDYIVPFSFSRELAGQIGAKFYEVEKGGHFLDRDGFTKLDLVYEILEKMMKLKG